MTIIQAQPLKQFGISGPISAIDNEVPVFDGVTGKKVKAATGIISPSSGRLKMSSTAPYLTLHNTAHEDTDYGRESELIFRGEQSGGEETTLGKIQVAHDGTADDQKGIMSFKVNDGDDADAPGTKMTILANGNVGIGTENPTSELEIVGSYDSVIKMHTTAVHRYTGMNIYDNNKALAASFMYGNPSAASFTDEFVFASRQPDIEMIFYQGGAAAGNERLRFKDGGDMVFSNGNVGIGTTSPLTKLSIQGAAGTDLMNVALPTTGASALYVAEDGNVGIGTDSPSAFLDIEFNSSSGSFIGAELTNTNASGKSIFRAVNNSGINLAMGVYGSSFGAGLANTSALAGSGSVVIFSDGGVSSGGTNHISFRTGGYAAAQEKVRINHLGNVGIGTTSPTAKLDIDSDILRLRTAKTPASAGDTGNQGDMCWDADFHYRCVATNTWKRTALTTW